MSLFFILQNKACNTLSQHNCFTFNGNYDAYDCLLYFRYTASYSGTWCDIPGANTEYISATGYLKGLNGTGFIEVQAVVNATMICFELVQVTDVQITYQSVSLIAFIPPLLKTFNVTSRVASRLNTKLPLAATKIEERINTMAASKLPICKPVTKSS